MSLSDVFRSGSTPNPFRRHDSGEHELYEEDGTFVLSVNIPGFDTDEIAVSWDDGILTVVAERDDDRRGRHKRYVRRFRFPKDIDDDEITAEYNNGILEVRLPVADEDAVGGRTIPVEA